MKIHPYNWKWALPNDKGRQVQWLKAGFLSEPYYQTFCHPMVYENFAFDMLIFHRQARKC